jgi:imidazolonepropionase-like amidohydrolase
MNQGESLAIVGGTVIDGNGGPPIESAVVLVKGQRIAAIGTDVPVPAGCKTLDARGQYLIPGLMDANVHLVLDLLPPTLIRYENRYDELALEAAQVSLRSGVTTVFDSWGPRSFLIKARQAINTGRAPGSRIFLAGNIVGLGGPYSEDFFAAARTAVTEGYADELNAHWQENVGPELLWMSPEQVREQLQTYTRSGINFLKYAVTGHSATDMQYIAFSPRVQRVIVEEARRAGLTVQTHTTTIEGVHLAVEAGVDLLQHADITGPRPMPQETVEFLVEKRVNCALLANTDVALSWYRSQEGSNKPLSRYLIADQNARALLSAGAVPLLSTDGGLFSATTARSPLWKKHVPPQESLLRFGEGHFHWLRAVEQKGLKAMDGLLAATRNIARAYGVDRDLGTLEAGKLADLLVLERNPLQAAEHYRSIRWVIKDGAVVDRTSLPQQKLLTH